MNDALEQFEEMYGLINEIITPTAPASGAIAATSDAPRKDFGAMSGTGYPPASNKKGLLDPYQSHPMSTMPDADRPPHLPFPLETVTDFLAQSYVYLNTANKQIKAAINNNPTLDPVYKNELKKFIKLNQQALQRIKYTGANIVKTANLNY